MIEIRQSRATPYKAMLSTDLGNVWLKPEDIDWLLSSEGQAALRNIRDEIDPAGNCERASERMRTLRESLSPETDRST